MMQEKKPDQAGADDASVKQEEASRDRKPGELSIEELAKVSGGRIVASPWGGDTNSLKWVPPIGTNPSLGRK